MNCCSNYGDCRQGRDCPVRIKKESESRREARLDLVLFVLTILVSLAAAAALLEMARAGF